MDSPDKSKIMGHVYMIKAPNNLYKLGRSNDIQKRFGALSTMSPVMLILKHTVFCRDYVAAEAKMHKKYADKRHHGEWFALSKHDINWIYTLSDGDLD